MNCQIGLKGKGAANNTRSGVAGIWCEEGEGTRPKI